MHAEDERCTEPVKELHQWKDETCLEICDLVHLKISHMKGDMGFDFNVNLIPRYVGLYMIVVL